MCHSFCRMHFRWLSQSRHMESHLRMGSIGNTAPAHAKACTVAIFVFLYLHSLNSHPRPIASCMPLDA